MSSIRGNLFTLAACLLVACNCQEILSQDVLYDNLDNVRSDGNDEDLLTPSGPNQRFAQQFFLGNNTNIDQVSVSLLRPRPGATGSLRFELWRDNGSGQPVPVDDPTGKIADLGKIVDVTQIPAGTFGEYTFDNLILGLEPNMPYWIVTDHEEVRGSGDGGVGFATVFGGDSMYPDPLGYDATAGTFGAAHIHAYRRQDPFWNDLNNFFGLEHFYQAMNVESMEEPKVTPSPSFTKVGEPIWRVGDLHHFSGPASSDEEWTATVATVSPPSTHCTPRDLPHDSLWADAIAAAGYEETTTFVPSSIDAAPNAVFTTLRLVPEPGETGSSLDAESGPIIPTELLPMHGIWTWTRNGDLVDEGFESDFGHPDCLVDGVDGLSSFQQISSTDATLFLPGTELTGNYETQVQIRDSGGDGWDIAVPFKVVDDVAGDVMFDGVLDATDIDMISSAVRQSLTDTRYDINGDGQVNAADRDSWVHGTDLANTSFGDANLDGEFNSADMNFVFAAREYEDNITLNSTWAEGDWNGDGDFDTADLALANTLIGDANLDASVTFSDFLALSSGFGSAGGWAEGDFDGSGDVAFPDFLALSANFGQSANAIAPVPEPASLTLFCVGLVAIKRRRRRLG